MARWCFERLFRELGHLCEIFVVGHLNCITELFYSGSFVFALGPNLFVHRSDLARRASSEYYFVCARETSYDARSLLLFRLESHILFRRLTRMGFPPWLDEVSFNVTIEHLRVRRPTSPSWHRAALSSRRGSSSLQYRLDRSLGEAGRYELRVVVYNDLVWDSMAT